MVSLRRNVSVLLAGDLTNKALRLLAAVVLARTLSLEQFGLFNVGIAIAGVAVTATTLGLPDLGARDAAIEPERASWIAGRVVTARVLALGALATLTALPAIALWPDDSGFVLAIAAMALCMSTSADWLARGLERMRALALAWILGGLTVAAGCGIVAATGGGAASALAVFVLAEAVVAGGCWYAVRRAGRPELGTEGLRALLKRSWPLGVSTIVVYSYYANVDTLLLAAIRSAEEAGLYSAAYRTFLVLNIVAIFASYALLPRLSREAAADASAQPPAYLLRTLWVLFAYGATVLGLAEIAGGPALELVYGSEFEGVAPTFILLCIGVAWYSVGYPAGYTLIASDRNRSFLAGAIVAGVANIAINLALIPTLGIEGAGIATAVAFAFAALVWLTVRAVPRHELVAFAVALLAISVGGAFAASSDQLRAPIGAVTIVAGVALGWHRARARSERLTPP